MSEWKPYDPAWLVELAKAQVPEEAWLPAALAACTMARQDSEAYIHFVHGADSDEPDSEWEAQTDITLKHPTEGELVLDILEGNRVGGVEFLSKLGGDA
jgi:hypothetical protein